MQSRHLWISIEKVQVLYWQTVNFTKKRFNAVQQVAMTFQDFCGKHHLQWQINNIVWLPMNNQQTSTSSNTKINKHHDAPIGIQLTLMISKRKSMNANEIRWTINKHNHFQWQIDTCDWFAMNNQYNLRIFNKQSIFVNVFQH